MSFAFLLKSYLLQLGRFCKVPIVVLTNVCLVEILLLTKEVETGIQHFVKFDGVLSQYFEFFHLSGIRLVSTVGLLCCHLLRKKGTAWSFLHISTPSPFVISHVKLLVIVVRNYRERSKYSQFHHILTMLLSGLLKDQMRNYLKSRGFWDDPCH